MEKAAETGQSKWPNVPAALTRTFASVGKHCTRCFLTIERSIIT